jgi:hypothetical protein
MGCLFYFTLFSLVNIHGIAHSRAHVSDTCIAIIQQPNVRFSWNYQMATPDEWIYRTKLPP